MDNQLFEVLSKLEMAEQERENGGSRFAVRKQARQLMEQLEKMTGDDPLCLEMRQRAGMLLNS